MFNMLAFVELCYQSLFWNLFREYCPSVLICIIGVVWGTIFISRIKGLLNRPTKQIGIDSKVISDNFKENMNTN